jgi:hypothetical protein
MTHRDVTGGGGTSCAAAKGAAKLNFKVEEKKLSTLHVFVIEPNKKKFFNNCDLLLNFVISVIGGLLFTRPGRRKYSYDTGRAQNTHDKLTLAKLTLMMTLAKASKR